LYSLNIRSKASRPDTQVRVYSPEKPSRAAPFGKYSVSMSQMDAIRILLADDHAVTRRGLSLLLQSLPGFTVVAEAADGREAVEQAAAVRPDIAVLDIAMPQLNGIEAARTIMATYPAIAVVILSLHSEEAYVQKALAAGVRGYVLKSRAGQDLVEAIKAVHRGDTFFSQEVLER